MVVCDGVQQGGGLGQPADALHPQVVPLPAQARDLDLRPQGPFSGEEAGGGGGAGWNESSVGQKLT